MKIRCFIAVQLNAEIKSQISTYIENLKRITRDIRWVKAENIHLTLKFLGEIESEHVEAVKKNLYPLSAEFQKFSLKIDGTGCFPGKKRPRVFWLGLEQGIDNPLFKLHKWIENELEKLGFEKEKRRFSPHLTLGRVRARNPINFSDLFAYFESNPFPTLDLNVSALFFIQSFLKPSGPEYQVIESYPLP
jgi:2'-5' RNA ligase